MTDAWFDNGIRRVFGVPSGSEAIILSEAAGAERSVLFIARDDVHLEQASEALGFFASGLTQLAFPAWDCLPFDRVSPKLDIVAGRVATLSGLASRTGNAPVMVLSTISAVLQRVPPKSFFAGGRMRLVVGERKGPDEIARTLRDLSYRRVDTVFEAGEYARRGDILDIHPGGADSAYRLDFFGEELERVRRFDPMTQRSTGDAREVVLSRSQETPLDSDAISRFRSGYRVAFAASGEDDPLYESLSAGRSYPGMEHWLPLFHEGMATLFDYLPENCLIVLDEGALDAAGERLDLIRDYHGARAERQVAAARSGAPYRPLPPDALYLNETEWQAVQAGRELRVFSPFDMPADGGDAIDLGGKPGREFGDIRARPGEDVYRHAGQYLHDLAKSGAPVLLDTYSNGSRIRMTSLLAERDISVAAADTWEVARNAPPREPVAVVLGLSKGFVLPGRIAVVTEQDILGERVVRRHKVKVRPENLIASISDLALGDLVVHAEHGIGRFDGLEPIDVSGAAHDCLKIIYAGDDKLFLPVENLEVLSRYGSETGMAQLDRLGGAGWQARKAKMKARLKDMADKLMEVAAARELKDAPKLPVPAGAYDEFSAKFPFEETEDQLSAIEQTLDDLAGGRPMDRLVCGDVGFGKTEVALRAAFACALEGKQVALVVPTTLLCRQHFQTFRDRFAGFPVRIGQLSRLVSAVDARKTKEGLASGAVDIVIGTHALLAKDVRFRDLALLIIDEEQHFGVTHKERLKQMKTDVHVLVLTATPIPRTLQMALTGLREMSLIATPPVDRLAVRTFVLPYDPLIVKEALDRELHRGGHVFYVCPRIADLDTVAAQVAEIAPEARIAVAHGQMRPTDLENVFQAFADRAYDILVSTNIIESGLDLPSVNTIIIHRADRFGLSQLYQLRGRVGRSKVRAYAYLTLPVRGRLTAQAEKRLQVMQTLDTLGAGFSLASHDLDIRGAGNLLGEEQSGHIREVGVELYQQMLEEAVANARGVDGGEGAGAQDWTPQISLGTEVLIPDHYVPDLNLRLELYRKISNLTDAEAAEDMAVEMIDRFGPLPQSVENLLDIVRLKIACRRIGVLKVEAGPKGGSVQFRNNEFSNPGGLVAWISNNSGRVKLRPDHRLVIIGDWDTGRRRFQGMRGVLRNLLEIAEAA
ncbi:MAG: transcription-repair coupling factor [Rhodospirillaceae bacterium]